MLTSAQDSGKVINPGQTISYEIYLYRDFVTFADFGGEIDHTDQDSRWQKQLRSCPSYEIYCVDRNLSAVSNVILVDNLP